MSSYKKFANALFKLNTILSKVELVLMSISMVILTAVMTWQVVTRYFIGIPATWAEELCRYLFIWTSFIGSAYAVWTFEHIEIDLIDNVFKAKFKNPDYALAWLKKVVLILIAVFSMYFLDLYLDYVLQIAKLKQYSGAMEINMVYPMASGVVGLVMIVFHAVSLLFMPIDGESKEKTSEEAEA